MPPRKPSSPPLPATYDEPLAQLEQIVAGLESGQLPLEGLLGQYQRGAQLLAVCRERLQAVQEQVKLLDGEVLRPLTQEDEA